ncbi:MAG: hypothetical protein AAGD18_18440 [Actinomycetota bacterium]
MRRPDLSITFHRIADRPDFSSWTAVRRTGSRVSGGYTPIGRGRIPGDLAHLAVEAHFGLDHGFWGLLAKGATFDHGTDQRPTRTGRAIVAEHRAQLADADRLAHRHQTLWARDEPTPVGSAFDELEAAWSAVQPGGSLSASWPFDAAAVAA